MSDESPIQRLQKIAEYRTARKQMRFAGAAGINAGMMWLMLTVQGFNGLAIDFIYLGLGAMQILIGIRNQISPSSTGFLLEGTTPIFMGGFNLCMQMMGVGPAGPMQSNILFDIASFAAGAWYLKRYQRVRAAFAEPPTKEQLQWLDEVVTETRFLARKGGGEMIEFRTTTDWTGRRLGDLLIFIDKNDMLTFVVDRHDVACIDKGKALFRKIQCAKLWLGEQHFPLAQFRPEMLSRFESWLPAQARLDRARQSGIHQPDLVPQ